jgi:hypothetical protein
MPVILRQVEGKKFRLAGHAYVDSITYGEMWNDVKRDQIEQIEII